MVGVEGAEETGVASGIGAGLRAKDRLGEGVGGTGEVGRAMGLVGRETAGAVHEAAGTVERTAGGGDR